MEKIINLLNNFFNFTNKIHDKLLNLEVDKSKKIRTYIFFIWIILAFIYTRTSYQIILSLLMITGLLFIVFNILAKIQEMLKSVRGFFETAGWAYIFLFIITGLIITNLFKENENIAAMIIIIFQPIIWIFISCCVETKVAVLCNSILVTVNGIIFSIWKFLTLFKIEEGWNKLNTGIEYEKLNLGISSFLLFTTVTLAMAAMICAIKKYLEDKKIEGNEVNNNV